MSHRVHVSLPLGGPSGAAGREVLRGVDLALEQPGGADVELVVRDSSGEDRDARAVANAERAAADPQAVAYLGDFHSSQVWATAPILERAGLLQVAPVATFTGLGGATLVRLAPDDRALAAAIADWVAAAGLRSVLVVHDADEDYGIPVGRLCQDALQERGIALRARPVWDHDEAPGADLGDARAVLYVGVAGSGAVGLWHGLHALDPGLWLLGTDGVAADWLAQELHAGAAARTRFFTALRAPLAFYGFEALRLIADAVAVGGGDRAATARAGRSTRVRDSVLGRYGVDEHGLTTGAATGRLAVAGGTLVWDRDRPPAG